MCGTKLGMALHWLADHFDELARPLDGRYVREPARADDRGTYYVPPPVPDPVTQLLIGGAAIGAAAVLTQLLAPRNRDRT
jgi:hypothetical protein